MAAWQMVCGGRGGATGSRSQRDGPRPGETALNGVGEPALELERRCSTAGGRDGAWWRGIPPLHVNVPWLLS
jgi:hypothetical protein